MPGRLNVAFLWHMHQPFYRDPHTGKYALPWVRLHAIKGYHDMLQAILQSGGRGVTFNFVPCLLKQLDDLNHGETDLYFDLSLKPAQDLEPAEKRLILRHFFSANPATMIEPYPRYNQLWQKRGHRITDSIIDDALKNFNDQEYRDLQVWFNLTWFGWAAEKKYKQIGDFKRKNRNFTEEEKKKVLEIQLAVMKDIVPGYRAALEENIIDISTTPFYHPILPLLIDSDSARISQPLDEMPPKRFQRPEDARRHLERSRSFFKELFGREPKGLWPSEGSVSPKTCELASETGFSWMASDERVLQATLQGNYRDGAIYRSHRLNESDFRIFFRDQFLSDAIGFRYSANPPVSAVNDFIKRLEEIARRYSNIDGAVVPIILDGENAWEYFRDGGEGFLTELYRRLANHKRLQLNTFSSICETPVKEDPLPAIFPASWINGSFRIWIGDPVKNLAWKHLAEAAEFLDMSTKTFDSAAIQEAREYLYIAEGSDWFWWYGQPNSSDHDAEFDLLFRSNLSHIYKRLAQEPPDALLEPLVKSPGVEGLPLFPIDPQIDGRESYFYEWLGARTIDAADFGGSMNFTSSTIEQLHYGLSSTNFFMRLDFASDAEDFSEIEIVVVLRGEDDAAISLRNLGHPMEMISAWQSVSAPVEPHRVALDSILELAVPFINLNIKEDNLRFALLIKKGELELERWPREGYYECPGPLSENIKSNWVV